MNKWLSFPVLCLSLVLPSWHRDAAAAEMPQVHLQTSRGEIVIELDRDRAPATVANFLEYINSGFYSGTVFHRVIPGFMIQGGGYTADGHKKATRAPLHNEADNGLTNRRGTIAMARTRNPHSATAQFFINLSDNPHLNHRGKFPGGWGYAVFGRVISGMEVVDDIARQPTGGYRNPAFRNAPRQPVIIDEVTVASPRVAAPPALK